MSDATKFRWDDLPEERLNALLSRRLITGARTMLAHVYLKKGCIVPKHHHENEQFTYILEGALEFLIGADGDQKVVVRAGEVLHLPSNLPHSATALEDTLDLDIFTPPRQDWQTRPTRTYGSRSYGRTSTSTFDGYFGVRYTRCTCARYASGPAVKMLGTNVCGLRSYSGNQLLCTCTMMRWPRLNV